MRLIKLKAVKRIMDLHFTPDGRRLLAVGGTRRLTVERAVWVDLVEGKRFPVIPLGATCYAVTPDLKRMAVGGSRNANGLTVLPVVTFDPHDAAWLASPSRWEEVISKTNRWDAIHHLAFDGSGKHLVIDHSLSWFADGRHLAEHWIEFVTFGNGNRRSFEWDVESRAMTLNPDATALAVVCGHCLADAPPRVEVFRTDTFQLVRTTPLQGYSESLPMYSPDGRTLAVVNREHILLLPDDSDKPRHSLSHPDEATAVAFTPDGRRLLSACHDGLLRIWDAATGQQVTGYDWGIGGLTAITVSPDGLTAAVAGQKGQVAVFDLD